MKVSKRSRWVKFVTVSLDTSESPALAADPTRSLRALAERAIEARHFGRKPKAGAQMYVRIVDMKLDEATEHLVVIYREVDVEGTDACYETLESGEVENHPKKPGQGNRATAHLVINLKGQSSRGGMSYRGALEVVPGLGVGVVESRLNASLGPLGSGTAVVGGEEVGFKMSVVIKPTTSHTIREELTQGVLNGFSLVKKSKPIARAVDEPRLVQEKERRLELSVVGSVADRLEAVVDIVKKRAWEDGYDIVRAHYDNGDGKPATAEINIKRNDALEDLVARQIKVTLPADVSPNQTEVDWVVANEIIKALGQET